MADAVGEAPNRLVPTKDKNRAGVIADRIGHRPAAFSHRELEERAALRALDPCGFIRLFGGQRRRFGEHQPQQLALGETRGRRAGRAGPRRRPRRPQRLEAEAVDLADMALRVTPISAAIWLHVRPLTTQVRSCSTRSGVQVATVARWVMRVASQNAAAVLGRADRAKAGATGGLLGRATARREFDGRERAGGRDHRAASAPKRLPARRFYARPLIGGALSLLSEFPRRRPSLHDSSRLPSVLTVL